MKRLLAVVVLVSSAAFAQAVIGSTLKLGSSDESAFPAASTLYRGGLRYGTDAGAVYFSNGSAWTALGTGSGGGTTYTSVADGGVVVAGTVVACEAASATGTGCVNTTTQTFAGAKTFTAGTVTGGLYYTAGGGSGVLNLSSDTHITMTRGNMNVSVNTVEASVYYGTGTGTQGYVGANATSLTLNGGTVSHNNGVRLNTSGGGSKPTCASGIRGTLWYVQGGSGVADTSEVCAKSTADTYAWVSLTDAISGSVDALTPSLAIDGSAVEMLSVSAGTLTATRTVVITVSGTAYATSGTTLFEFYADVNGTPLARRRLFFNSASVHHAWSGSWVVTLPATAVTIKLYGIRMSGVGTITLNSDDFVNLTYQG